MYIDEEHRRYGDLTILEPIVEQRDDEIATSPMSNSSTGTNYLEEQRRALEETQQFEQLEKEFASNRRGVRVKFDDEQRLPITKTTHIKTEPCFQVNSSEDQVTKHFYENEYQSKNEKNNSYYREISSKTPSEHDSLDGEYILACEEKDTHYEPNENSNEIHYKITDQVPLSSSPNKSILKKSQKKENRSVLKSTRSRSPSPSSSSLKKKQTNSQRSEVNQVQHLAEATAKQTSSRVCPASRRSLFEPTVNIFDSSNSNSHRQSRLQYYIKPYRGETYIRPNINKQQPRSLSEQRFSRQTEPTVWHTFSNQFSRPLNRRQHISWSPVREYIHQGRDKIVKNPPKKNELFPPLLTERSSSNPCLRSASPSMIPIPVRHQSFHPLSTDLYETSSMINYSLTPNSQYEEKKEIIFAPPVSDIVHSQNFEHNETIQRYDRLLEKMRETDEQLQLLSRSWKNNTYKKTSNQLDVSVKKTIDKNAFFSPTILQICLIILVIFNLTIVYFFNEINIFWSQYVTNSGILEQQDEETTYF
ncbi:unnamed protein product [Adineta steineri]|uniref:Uncharacterized protein n=1 Tax=Adineta steineri TaxID=433720 RepID=A0A813WL94_9BILA|nr:unnamed protein product [Adineta steineri]CAF1374520.1 unnamed protein product [Adineta steineri]